MSLILAGIVFAGTSGALALGRWIAKRRADAQTEANAPPAPPAPKEEKKETDADEEEEPPKPKAPPTKKREEIKDKVHLEGFVCQLGDVLMRITGEEAWLAGGVVLSEERPIAVLFLAPDAKQDTAIYVRTRPRDSIIWLEPLDPKAILVGGEPPSSVEHNGIRFDRTRRLPLRPKRVGVGAPDTGDAVVVAEYESAGAERLIVMKANSGSVFAYRGLELEEGSFEVIASGESTLD